MAIFYVDSTAGSDTAPYDTWAKAAASLRNVLILVTNGVVDGDTVLVHYQHQDPHTSNTSFSANGLFISSGLKIYSVDKADNSYIKMGTNGYIGTTTGDYVLDSFDGDILYFHGITIKAGDLFSTGLTSPSHIILKDGQVTCERMTFFGFANLKNVLIDCDNITGAGIFYQCVGKILAEGLTFQNIDVNRELYQHGTFAYPIELNFKGCDLSLINTLLDGDGSTVGNPVYLYIDHSKLSSSYDELGSTWSPKNDVKYKINITHSEIGTPDRQSNGYILTQTTAGTVEHETTETRTDGANDGRIDYSLKFTPSSNCSPANPLYNDVIIGKGAAPGNKTVTVHFKSNTDNAITTEDVWIDILSADESATSSTKYQLTSTQANYGAGVTCETGDGWGSGYEYKIVKVVTPDVTGPLYVRIYCGNPSLSAFYVDPLVVFD